MREALREFTVLYAEDDIDVQSKMSEYLKLYFKNVYVASNGLEALQLHEKYLPDIAMLDINMPEVNGLEVARRIRRIDTRVRIIILTAYVDKKLLLQAAEIDMSKYLVKPISRFALKEAFNKVALELISISKNYIMLGDEIIYYIEKDILFCKEKEIYLSLKEKKLFTLLVSNRDTYITFESIMAYLWDENFANEISKDSVKSQISNLRKKIPGIHIENVYGKGYCLK